MSGRPNYGTSSGMMRPQNPNNMGGMNGGFAGTYGGYQPTQPNVWNTSTSYNPGSMQNPWQGADGVQGSIGPSNYNTGINGTRVIGDPRTMMNNAPGMPPGVQTPTPDPYGGVTGDPRTAIGRPQTPMINRGPGVSSQPLGIVATGPLGSNGMPTVSFDDVDRYQRGLLGL